MRKLDWAHTPVGAPETWPQSLRTAVALTLESKFGMMVAWGSELTQFYNDTFRPILGDSKHPALGRGTRETFPEAWHIVGPLFERVFAGEAVAYENMLVPLDRNGFLEECYFHYCYAPIRDESGGVGGIHVTVNETSSRVLAERRLAMLSELGRRTAGATSEAEVWRAAAEVLASNPLDVPFAFQYRVEPGGERASRVAAPASAWAPASNPLGRDEPGLWPLDPKLGLGGALLRDIPTRFGSHTGPSWPEPVTEALVLPVTRSELALPYGFLVAGISPRLSLGRQYRDFFGLVADHIAAAVASARAFAEERQRAELLADLDRQKTAFFGNVSHELRTPLTLILGPVDQALETGAPLAGADLAVVQRNAVRLSRLVGTLLDFSRIEAGRADASYQPIDAGALTAALASNFTHLIERAGLRFVMRCPPLGEVAYLDPEMWERIVLNLLSNAFKFTLTGSIEISTSLSDGELHLTVTDTGSGIPEQELHRVFERFHTVRGAPSRSHEGTGIGLSLVRELARLHGGRVDVRSTLGAGSRFGVHIPLGRAHLPPERVRDAPRVTAASRPWLAPSFFDTLGSEPAFEPAGATTPLPRGTGPLPTAPTHGARILVVDDNADMRGYLQRLLSAEGWVVDTVADGVAALAHVREKRPDLLISDVMMPRLDGIELLRALEREASPVPVILLSARAGDEATAEGLRAGADDYLVKPFSARELTARVGARLEIARARADAAHARARREAQLLQAPVAVAVLRCPELRYELANPLYLEMVGRQGVVGKTVWEVFPDLPADAALFRMLEDVYSSGKPFSASDFRLAHLEHGQGALEDAYFNVTCQPLRDATGEVVEIICVALNVTPEVLARQRIESLLEELQLADHRKDEFLATLAHELRNPMAAISTALSLLDSAELDTRKAPRYMQAARRQVNNLVRLVDDLLDVARITRGKIELRKEALDLSALIEHAVQATRSAIEARQHTLSVHVEPKPLTTFADATRIEQIVVNLLTNAAKYTEPGGHIAVTAGLEPGAARADERAREHAVIRVRDSGRGIPRHMLDKVFDLFTQVSPSIDRGTGGLGLGLTLVKHLSEMHGGSASARSDGPGKGSEFIIRLPSMTHFNADSPNAASQHSSDGAGPGPQQPRYRVLIVEDSEDVRELLAECVRSLGHEVHVAADGIEGAACFASVSPDIALLDVGLPGIDGYELARRIRAHPGGATAHLVALTGYGGAEVKREAERAGFNLQLTKPIDIQGLKQVFTGYEASQRA